MNYHASPNIDGAGGDAPDSQSSGLVLAIDAAEARLFRKQGHKCVTSAKMRAFVSSMLEHGSPERAVESIARFSGVSDADSPDRWPIWAQDGIRDREGAGEIRAALNSLPRIPTPLSDPESPYLLPPGRMWCCRGTTVLVASDTFELVRVADTYAGFDCYRPHGRMDEPFRPEAGRVCLITLHELRLLRLTGLPDAAVVLTYRPEEAEDPTGMAVTPRIFWPTPLRALCGEHPGLTVGVATGKVDARHGNPFFLGLTRGMAFESAAETSAHGRAALAYCVQTNARPGTVRLNVVVWEGGDDVRRLACYGGLSIFLNEGGRRKVQLRSLGLARSGTVAGQPVYDLSANESVLLDWAVRRTFDKPKADQRSRNKRRVRCSKQVFPEYARGTSIISYSPSRIRETHFASRSEASKLSNLTVATEEGCGVTTVPLKTLGAGRTCYFNGRSHVGEDGRVSVDQKRWKIRCALFESADTGGLAERLKSDPHVLIVGKDADGRVFGVVRVANGTEDQQREAVTRWAQGIGRAFPHASGCQSWTAHTMTPDYPTAVGEVLHVCWRAAALETACYERYQTGGDYSKPLEIKRRGVAGASERARAYADTVQGLASEGERNSTLAGAMLNIGTKFGEAALLDVLPVLTARSTLSEAEQAKVRRGVLKRMRRNGPTAHN